MDISFFRVNNKKAFQSDSFSDLMPLKNYLRSIEEGSKNSNPVIDFVTSITDIMCQLRFMAEERHKVRPFRAKDKRKALPLSWEDIAECITSEDKEPPLTIIARIAQNEMYVIDHVLHHIRKVLTRERKSVHISAAQQLDSHCLRWLTKQPGVTPAQKAGSRQRILSVVRMEAFNTFENRVLKAFLTSCVSACSIYLRHYDTEKNHNSSRIGAVRKLLGMCKNALNSSEMEQIATLRGLSAPNYVLRNNPYYSKIWTMYQSLLHQMQMVEMAWTHRHILFQDYFLLMINLILDMNYPSIYKSDIWINFIPQNGHFIQKPFFSRVFRSHQGKIVELSVRAKESPEVDVKIDMCFVANGDKVSIALYYISQEAETISLPAERCSYSFIFNESKAIIPNADGIKLLRDSTAIMANIETEIPQIVGRFQQ